MTNKSPLGSGEGRKERGENGVLQAIRDRQTRHAPWCCPSNFALSPLWATPSVSGTNYRSLICVAATYAGMTEESSQISRVAKRVPYRGLKWTQKHKWNKSLY